MITKCGFLTIFRGTTLNTFNEIVESSGLPRDVHTPWLHTRERPNLAAFHRYVTSAQLSPQAKPQMSIGRNIKVKEEAFALLPTGAEIKFASSEFSLGGTTNRAPDPRIVLT